MEPLQYLTNEVCEKYHIQDTKQKATFLAQAHYESQGFTRLVENLNYTSAERLMAVFPSKIRSVDEASRFIMNPSALANYVYGNRMGNTMPNDGYMYRGRGVLQLTGRTNYNLFRLAEGIDALGDPDLLCNDEKYALISGLWFWWQNQLYKCDTFEEVTKKITGNPNPKTNGIAERKKLYQQYLKRF
jgi:putative chitinase